MRPSRMLGVTRAAVYLEVEDSSPAAVIAILARDSARLPNGIVLADPQSVGPFADVVATTPVRVGRCSVELDAPTGPLSVRVGRWWYPRPPRAPGSPHDLAAALSALDRLLAGARGGLPSGTAALLDHRAAAPERARAVCARLVGAGPGLTPSGDDLLSGFLLAVRHFGAADRFAALAAAAHARAATATTALSACLLAHAARGEGTPQTTGVLDALSGHRPPGPALRALRALGHTSGTDLALGVLAGTRAALSPGASAAHAADAMTAGPPTRSTR